MLDEKPVRVRNPQRIRTIIFAAVIVAALAGGITLLVGIGGGSSKGGQATSGDNSPLPLGTIPTGNTDTFLAGTATPTYPAGDPNEIAVVYLGPVTVIPGAGATMPVVIRNNTPATVSHLAITGIAEDQAGTHLATGSSLQMVEPAQLTPGTIGYTFIHFDGVAPPPNSVYEFTVKSSPADTSTLNSASVQINEANLAGPAISGSATNTTGRKLRGPFAVQAFCFDDQGALNSVQNASTNGIGDVPIGGTVKFAVPLHGATCSTFLVGISGFYT